MSIYSYMSLSVVKNHWLSYDLKKLVFRMIVDEQREIDRLTYNVELHEVAHLGLGAHLALIYAGVPRLYVLHLKIS